MRGQPLAHVVQALFADRVADGILFVENVGPGGFQVLLGIAAPGDRDHVIVLAMSNEERLPHQAVGR